MTKARKPRKPSTPDASMLGATMSQDAPKLQKRAGARTEVETPPRPPKGAGITYRLKRRKTTYENENKRKHAAPMPPEALERPPFEAPKVPYESRDALDGLDAPRGPALGRTRASDPLSADNPLPGIPGPCPRCNRKDAKVWQRPTGQEWVCKVCGTFTRHASETSDPNLHAILEADGEDVTPGAMVPTSGDQAVKKPSQQVSVSLSKKARLPVFLDGAPVDTDRELSKLKRVPSLHCSVCAIGVDCPEYTEGYVCAYNDAFRAMPSRDVQSVVEGIRWLVDKNKERTLRAIHYEEQVNGGALDPAVTRQIESAVNLEQRLLELDQETMKMELKFSADDDDSAKVGGGILSQLFSQKPAAPALASDSGAKVIDVGPQKVEKGD